MKEKMAAQLFTVKKEMSEDFSGTLKALKRMGWPAVQISALPQEISPREVKQVLDDNQLNVAGMHISLDRLMNDLHAVIEEANLYGTKDLVCPSLPQEYQNEKGYKQVRAMLNSIAREAKGYRISYHNHAFEFNTTVEGKNALDYLLEPVPGNDLLAEIDVFWIKKGGYEPLTFIEPYANRMPIIHLKDMTNDERETFAEINTGQIDFIPILKWAEANGVEWFAVEQDQCDVSGLHSLEISLSELAHLLEKV
ncbi:sugar phosphate isomerase/epimerase [Bacillaceae bacterium SIJ1]|uniref:sugar phosphate isomerase/epimerase family protein n=1 Tax=Litoribacterium kuwaitense TaxID=1398745 RepID=UPI0013ED9109|nr:sugar phosphate isomerase/epimerase [Litoribacterium kuwaitense]NGP43619.1 sugar phosphate isomerase/epimerase [Litoribacterium kuwaitense]